jgi:single-strand DNA-binding protein
MASFNKWIGVGNVTRDVEMRQAGATNVAAFGLACSRRFTTAAGEKKEETLFIDCTAFGKQADTINKYVTKGKPLMIEGRLKLDQWEDKKDGAKRSKITCVVESFQFMPDGKGGQNESPSPTRPPGGAFPAPGEDTTAFDPADIAF